MSNADYTFEADDIHLIPAVDFNPNGPLDDSVPPSTILEFDDYVTGEQVVPNALPYLAPADVNPASRSSGQPPPGREVTTGQVTQQRRPTTPSSLTSDPGQVTLGRAYVVACLVFWFCGFVFGSFAYVQAVRAEDASYDGDLELAKKRRKASYVTSIVGLCIGLAVLLVCSGVLLHPYYVNHL